MATTPITAIPSSRVPVVDPKTGLITREWYRFFSNLYDLTGGGTNSISLTDLQLAPVPPVISVGVDAQGGIRKTSNQAVGTLGAAYVTVTNYDSVAITPIGGLTLDLAVGSVETTYPTNYVVTVNTTFSCTPDNNSSRFTYYRLFNATDNAPVADSERIIYVGAYAAGGTINLSSPLALPALLFGKKLVVQIGGGSTFASVIVDSAAFTMIEVPRNKVSQ